MIGIRWRRRSSLIDPERRLRRCARGVKASKSVAKAHRRSPLAARALASLREQRLSVLVVVVSANALLCDVEAKTQPRMHIQGSLEREFEFTVLALVLDGAALLGPHADRRTVKELVDNPARTS